MATQAPGIVKRPNAYFIDPTRVSIDPTWNVRFDWGDITELARQILAELKANPASGGLLVDLRVQRLSPPTDVADFKIVDGERRMTAIKLLMSEGVDGSGPIAFPEGVPAKIESASASTLDLLFKMYLSNEGKKFLPLEEAAFFKRLQGEGLTIAQIEERVKKSDNYIVGALALLDADPTLVAAVKSGEVGAGVAKSIAVNARGDKAKQAEITADIKAAGKDKVKRRAVLKKIEAARVAKAAKKGKTLKIKSLTDADLNDMGQRVAKNLVAKATEAGWDDVTTAANTADEKITAMVEVCKMDEAMAAAYTLGVLQGLKAAAGLKVELDI